MFYVVHPSVCLSVHPHIDRLICLSVDTLILKYRFFSFVSFSFNYTSLSLLFLALPFHSLPIPSLPFSSPPFLSLPFPSFPFLSLFSLPFLSSPFLSLSLLSLPFPSFPFPAFPFPAFPFPSFPFLSPPLLSSSLQFCSPPMRFFCYLSFPSPFPLVASVLCLNSLDPISSHCTSYLPISSHPFLTLFLLSLSYLRFMS